MARPRRHPGSGVAAKIKGRPSLRVNDNPFGVLQGVTRFWTPYTDRMRNLRLVGLVLALACALVTGRGCGRGQAGPGVTVLAASSLADALREVAAAFTAEHAGVEVTLSFGASNQLRTQLDNGVKADVFLSADRRHVEGSKRVVDEASVRAFAANSLAVLVPSGNPGGVTGFGDLAKPGLRVLIANKAVPLGRATDEVLRRARESAEFGSAFITAFEGNVVSLEQSASALATKVSMGEVDAGIGYMSDGASTRPLKVIALPEGIGQRTEYVAAVCTGSHDRVNAARFVEFLASPKAAEILARRGFEIPQP